MKKVDFEFQNFVICFKNSLLENKANISKKDIEWCRTFFISSNEIYNELYLAMDDLIHHNQNNTISYSQFLQLIISISHIIREYGNVYDIVRLEDLIILVEFTVFTLIEYNIIYVPDDMKPEIESMIKHSVVLLRTNMIVEKTKTFYDNILNLFHSCMHCC